MPTGSFSPLGGKTLNLPGQILNEAE
ncbi:hypothetical protein PIIN_11610 [Serendipita indica DSM 11827]|uniref:Uncharacterized protein n=1 Tax=Serendipita indica (strain DSM 11827) TaxID=1109443 RepID=G4U239_SERID|nr:hypothetical protein PIIN_11610 [Serendipita indica DSM 11827]